MIRLALLMLVAMVAAGCSSSGRSAQVDPWARSCGAHSSQADMIRWAQ